MHARTFDSLRLHRNYRLYILGQSVAGTGNLVKAAAQSWLVLGLTHSAVAVGLVAFWTYGPYAVLGLVGPTVSDRYDYRRTLLVTQTLLMLLAAVLWALTLSRHMNVSAIYAVAAASGIVTVVDTPSRQALTLQMVGRDGLGNAIALYTGVQNATRVVGPLLAGLLIAGAGVGVCFALNAVSYLAALLALLAMRPAEFVPMDRSKGRRSTLQALAEGLAYARGAVHVRLPLAALGVVSVLAINWSVLLPVLARQTLHQGPGMYGLMVSVFGLGAVVGALGAASMRRLTWPILLGSGVAFGLGELALAPQHSVWAALACLLVTGSAYALYTSATNTMVQAAAPDALQARVAGLYSYVFLGTSPLGALAVGYLSQRGGTELAFLMGGGVTVAAMAVLFGILRLARTHGPPGRLAPSTGASGGGHERPRPRGAGG